MAVTHDLTTRWRGDDLGAKSARRAKLPPTPYSVVSTRLPSGEGLPLMVRADTWHPLGLAMRWVVLTRRHECAERTLRADLNALRSLYAWGDRFPGGLDARVAGGAPLDAHELQHLKSYLQHPGAEMTLLPGTVPSAAGASASAGARAAAALAFLVWALAPANRNDPGAAPTDADAIERQYRAVLGPLAALAGKGRRIVPISASAASRVESIIAPVCDARGAYLRPLRWHARNPFKPHVRLRNWLMWVIARDTGLRLGEILGLWTSDFGFAEGLKCVLVVRRPDAPEDVRSQRPAAKTLERAVPLGPRGEAALRAYLQERPPHGRKPGSVYLLTSNRRRPLGAGAAAWVAAGLRAAGDGTDFSWHSLRHAWAEDFAEDALGPLLRGVRPGDEHGERAAKHLVMDKLGFLGGWSPTSRMPAYYAGLAVARSARRDLADRQNRRAAQILAGEPDDLPFEDEL